MIRVDGIDYVRDVDLARQLGYAHVRMLRTSIKRNLTVLEAHGPLMQFASMVTIGSGAQRAVREFWLHRGHSIVMACRSNMLEAVELQKGVIAIFGAAMDGFLVAAPGADVSGLALPPVPAGSSSTEDARFAALEARLARLEKDRPVAAKSLAKVPRLPAPSRMNDSVPVSRSEAVQPGGRPPANGSLWTPEERARFRQICVARTISGSVPSKAASRKLDKAAGGFRVPRIKLPPGSDDGS